MKLERRLSLKLCFNRALSNRSIGRKIKSFKFWLVHLEKENHDFEFN